MADNKRKYLGEIKEMLEKYLGERFELIIEAEFDCELEEFIDKYVVRSGKSSWVCLI